MCRRIESGTRRLSDERCKTMLDHYDQVSGEARRFEEVKQALMHANTGAGLDPVPWFGPADAKVTMVEFADFTSSECARGSLVWEQVRRQHPEVRFVFRQFPRLDHPDAHRVAEASLAAHAQGRFWEFHDVLFSNQHDLGPEALARYAKMAGLDVAKFRKALDSHRYRAQVDADVELGKKAMIRVVPAMFSNGDQVEFPYDLATLEEAIAGAQRQ